MRTVVVPALEEFWEALWGAHTSDWALLSRLFSWALLRFLNCLFLNVQLYRGQMKMVHKAAQAVRPALTGTGTEARPSPEPGPAPSAGWEKCTAL